MSKSRRQRKTQSQNLPTKPPAPLRKPEGVYRGRAAWATAVLSLVLLLGVGFFWHQFKKASSSPAPPPLTGLAAPSSQSLTNLPPAPATLFANEKAISEAAPAGSGKDSSAVELNQQANKLLESGDLAGAIQLYEKALGLTPNDEDLHYNLGIALVKAGELEKAEKEYREALRLLPDYAEVHNNLGNLLLRMGRLNEAEEQLNAAIAIMPEFAAAHNNLGIVRQRQKRLEDAAVCFEKAVKCDTNYFEAHFNLASAYLLEHQPDKAVPELREVLRINPSFEPAQRALSKITGQAPTPGP